MLGIDINEVQEVQVKDAVFKVGVIPYGIRIKLDSAMLKYAKVPAEELMEQVSADGAAFMTQNLEYVRYGIRGHSGIVDKKGKEIAFKSCKDKAGDREVSVVADETLDMYLAMGIIAELSQAVYKANALQKEEEKN